MRMRKIGRLAILSLTLPVFSLQAFSENVPPLSAARADKVLVLKSQRALLLMKGDEVLKRYIVSLGNPVGPKIRQGDHKTPEGTYVLDRHNANSQFYRSIHISYPNTDDVARAKKLRVPAGGDLFIHGLPNDFRGHSDALGDWTEGCIAVSNAEMDEIWRMVADGTPIEIRP
jgi:murein L,D-transpeptidase YafK